MDERDSAVISMTSGNLRTFIFTPVRLALHLTETVCDSLFSRTASASQKIAVFCEVLALLNYLFKFLSNVFRAFFIEASKASSEGCVSKSYCSNNLFKYLKNVELVDNLGSSSKQ